ncbi:MAG: DEAD/DEAH box helicase [Candidatus Latescibacterota bacterium]|nr:MAG: DEAD/DEAH box helicase [Candidatus Latescibacterota bacterium]
MIKASVDRGRITLSFRYDPHLVEKCKSILGARWNKAERFWAYPATRNAARAVWSVFAPFPDGPANFVISQEFHNLLTDIELPPDGTPIPNVPTKPWEHQRKAWWYVVSQWGTNGNPCGAALLGMDMGTGKTKVTIDLIQVYGFKRVLVTCPTKVVKVWGREAKRHCDPRIRFLLLGKGPITKRADRLLTAAGVPTPLVVVTNYEATRAVSSYREMHDAIKRTAWDLLVLDEIHRIKAPGGMDSRFFDSLADMIPCRLGLTGTSLGEGPMDAYGQFRFLDRSIFGTSFVRFRGRYAIMGGFEGKKVVDYQNEGEFAERFGSITYEVRAEDVLDLPDEHHVEREVELSEATQKHYSEMDEEFTTWVGEDGGDVSVQNAMSRIGKLQEITGGFVRDPDTKRVHRLGSEKAEELGDVLDDLRPDEPLLVCCRFRPDLDIVREIVEKKGRTYSELSGKADQSEGWMDGKTDVLGVQIDAGKEGIDLTRARYCVIYSMSYSRTAYAQFLRRIRRPRQKSKTVTFIHLVASGTVDKRVYRALLRKTSVVESILEEVRAEKRRSSRARRKEEDE